MIVMKFGGTSVQDSAAINQAVEIVAGKLDRSPVVVVSAMAGVTDALLLIARLAREHRFDDASPIIDQLRERHLTTARELLNKSAEPSFYQVAQGVTENLKELEGFARSVATLGELTPRTQDTIASFGERLSSALVASALRARGV